MSCRAGHEQTGQGAGDQADDDDADDESQHGDAPLWARPDPRDGLRISRAHRTTPRAGAVHP